MKTTVTTLANIAVHPKSAFTQLVERLFAENAKTIGNQGTLTSVIGTCFASMSQVQHTWKREAFRDVLLHLEAQGCYGLLRDTACINALANIASFGNKLVREIHTWKKDSCVVENQMSALIKHCFVQYEVPEFLENAFYYENKVHMLWYVQLGRGESVMSLSGFPVKFTKKMAHEFKNAPANYTVVQAIRWAQAKGYGASAEIAETLAWSSLTEHFEHEEFWATVICFLAKHETLSYDKVQEILFYIHNQFEENKNYTMEGRNWNALVKQSDEWHIYYHKRMAALNRADWETSGIHDFAKTMVYEGETIHYNIIELTNSEALYEEGYEMSHCVAEYEYECIEGSSAIFSLRKKVAETEEILATIEVALAIKTIVQAKAKYNENISLVAENLLTEWAEKEQLTLDYDEYYAGEHQVVVPQAAPLYAPQDNVAHRTKAPEVNWKLVLYIILLLAKACAMMAK
ncbi:PcfJ domain-containing protein [Flavobacterium phycosphaerae]|uniref:PcfJ domain-containing protein n=1 Tax=Flavobacterium phycosphaerae TaxID=2697515 RepID=UPI00138A4F52|nr:PcfJ domain-containing protein [Flavobacterium phycosphaerae]